MKPSISYHTTHHILQLSKGRHGRNCMVGGFTTTCAISAYHH